MEIPPPAAQQAAQVQQHPAGRNPRQLHFEGGHHGLVPSGRFQFFGRKAGGILLLTFGASV